MISKLFLLFEEKILAFICQNQTKQKKQRLLEELTFGKSWSFYYIIVKVFSTFLHNLLENKVVSRLQEQSFFCEDISNSRTVSELLSTASPYRDNSSQRGRPSSGLMLAMQNSVGYIRDFLSCLCMSMVYNRVRENFIFAFKTAEEIKSGAFRIETPYSLV